MALNQNFYNKPILDIEKFIASSATFSVIGISDFGRTVFLKYLATLPLADNYIFVDIYDLAPQSRVEFFKLILSRLGEDKEITTEAEAVALCRVKLTEMVQKYKKIVIILNRLDLLQFPLDRSFFDSLRTFRMIDPAKIMFILGLCTPIHQVASNAMLGSDIVLFSKIYYLPLYSQADLIMLAKQYGHRSEQKETFKRALNLSGGHFQLFQLLLRDSLQKNIIDDDFIKLSLKNILKHLNYKQKKDLIDIALGKRVTVDDPYLLSTGMIRQEKNGYEFFTPLLREYLLMFETAKLSAKEKSLLQLLLKNQGQIVSRETIFNIVWGANEAGVTDWALDALAYRLRKNLLFTSRGYILEGHKKQGYSLTRDH